ncbi:MAG: TetR/AcrR family transcriptional regulator [Candidatus Eiseniibacteriota bacterium]
MLESATKTALLDLAQELAQTRGLNAFSFQDLARGVGIRTASVHHHFATKGDLGREMMTRYRDRFRSELDLIDAGARSPRRKLELFADLFRRTLRQGNRLCLCGMLATEYATLPPAVQREVKAFYDETEAWLTDVLERGRDDGIFAFHGSPAPVAKTFFATLEGAMIAARTFEDESRLARAARWLLASLDGPSSPRRK